MSNDQSLSESTGHARGKREGLFWVFDAADPDAGFPVWAASASEAHLRGGDRMGSAEGEVCVTEFVGIDQAELLRSAIEILIVRHGPEESAKLILQLACESMVRTAAERRQLLMQLDDHE